MKKLNYSDFHGIVLYDIGLDGCLNGVYTNNDINGLIYNEIARKRSPSKSGIEGDYVCSYVDNGNVLQDAILTISAINKTLHRTYKFQWTNPKGKLMFEGVGFIMNGKQIAVYYKEA